MIELVRELQTLSAEVPARVALRAFIAVRKRYVTRYNGISGEAEITPEHLVAAIRALVRNDSEQGRRAQAVVAGLMDAFAGPDRVESGRIHDPSRNYPGDVCVRRGATLKARDGALEVRDKPTIEVWERAFEVRDKPVTALDVQIFCKKCIDMGVREVALVMVAGDQLPLDEAALRQWASEFGIAVSLFHGWESFVDQVLFWAGDPKPVAASRAIGFIHKRLVSVEVAPATVALWRTLTKAEDSAR